MSLPYHQVTQLSKFRKAIKALTNQQEQFPSSGKIRKHLELSLKKWEAVMKARRLTRLTPIRTGDEHQKSLYDELSDKELEPDDLVIQKDEDQRVLSHLYELSDRELLVIYRSFGLDDHPPQTLEEIGLLVNMSYEGVRKMKLRILKRLRESVQS